MHIASVISGDADVWAHAEDAAGHISTISFDGDGNMFSGKLRLSTTGNGQIILNKTSGMMVTNRVLVADATAKIYLAAQF